MSGDIITIEQVETLFNRIFDERGLASQVDLQNYARKTDIHEAVKRVDATHERMKIAERRIELLEGIPKSIEMISDQIKRTHDIAQSTNNLALRMADISQQNRTRIDDIDKAQDQIKDEFTRGMSKFSDTLNDVVQRSMLTVEASKRMDEQVKTVIKMSQETQRMVSEFLVHSAQEQAKNEPLLAYVAKRKQFEETVGENIKGLLTIFFKDRLRMGMTVLVGAVTVGGTLIELAKVLLGG